MAGGQRVRLANGEEYERAKLPELMALRDKLKAEELLNGQGQPAVFQPVAFFRG